MQSRNSDSVEKLTQWRPDVAIVDGQNKKAKKRKSVINQKERSRCIDKVAYCFFFLFF